MNFYRFNAFLSASIVVLWAQSHSFGCREPPSRVPLDVPCRGCERARAPRRPCAPPAPPPSSGLRAHAGSGRARRARDVALGHGSVRGGTFRVPVLTSRSVTVLPRKPPIPGTARCHPPFSGRRPLRSGFGGGAPFGSAVAPSGPPEIAVPARAAATARNYPSAGPGR